MKNHPKALSPYKLKDWIQSNHEKLFIVDVRENAELEIANFPYTDIHIPMSKVSIEYLSSKNIHFKEKIIVVLCHMGIRSYNFGCFLLENNLVNEVWNLEEGIDGWSRYVDSSIQRY